MRKLFLSLFLAASVISVADAQTSAFTLDQCIDYALKNSIDVVNSRLSEESAVARVREITGLGMPQISGTVSITHNEKLGRFFGRNIVSANNPDAFGFFIDIPDAQDGDIVAGQKFLSVEECWECRSHDQSIGVQWFLFRGASSCKGPQRVKR